MTAHKFTPREVNALYESAIAEMVMLDAICDAAHDAMMKGTAQEATEPNGATYTQTETWFRRPW